MTGLSCLRMLYGLGGFGVLLMLPGRVTLLRTFSISGPRPFILSRARPDPTFAPFSHGHLRRHLRLTSPVTSTVRLTYLPRRPPGRATNAAGFARFSKWRRDECGFLAVGKYWSINKRLHIMRWHPDMRAMLSLRRPVGLLPWTPACIWKCRYCDKGQGTEGSSDSRLHARLHHREQCHPDKPRAHFLLVRANNAPVATKAVRNKGAASHLMRLKKGEAGEHDPIRVATPPTGKAKKNRVLYRVLCRKCGAYAARLKDIANAPCRLFANKGPQRKKLVERLTAALERTDLSEEVRDNTMRAVEVIKQINQQAVVAEPREHRLEAIAWPIGGFSVRFLCSLCRRIHVNTGAFRNQPCVGEAWSQYSKGQLAKLRALASEGGTAGNTASALLRRLQPEAGVQEP